MKRYIYSDLATDEIIFVTEELNYVDKSDVDAKMTKETGRPIASNPPIMCRILNLSTILCGTETTIGRYDKNKKLS
jgi:hypothetical protein